MIREEEDDTTQEMRLQIAHAVKMEKERMISKLDRAMIPVKDEWTDGLVTGLKWAIRVLNGDKSAD